MALLTLLDAQLAFGHVPLLDHADFALEAGERVGLIGRNGAGKSSLLRILGGLESADDGQLQAQQSLRVAFVAQEPELADDATVFDAVAQSLAPLRALMDSYAAGQGDLDALQERIEAQDGWTWRRRPTSRSTWPGLPETRTWRWRAGRRWSSRRRTGTRGRR